MTKEADQPAPAVRTGSALARLLQRPRRFGFDAAVRILAGYARKGDPAEAARYRAPLGAAYAGPEVASVTTAAGAKPVVTTPVMALTGPTGVLPRHYGEAVQVTMRKRSSALRDFLELLAQRFIGHFARAGIKYRPTRAAETRALIAREREAEDPTPARGAQQTDPIAAAILSFVGYGTPHLLERFAAGPEPLLHYAGLLSMRPRSAERLQALLSDWLGRKVEVIQLVGDWLNLPPDQRTRLPQGHLPGAFNQLGVDATIGVRAWDIQACVLLRIGPLGREDFSALLPDRPLLTELVALARAFVGLEIGFAVNPVLEAQAIPGLRLADQSRSLRLGWNTWLPQDGRRAAAPDAIFAAELVEARDAARRRA